ncbi:MAG: PrsW family glutamic-type intramembrane protease [Patescibacteria group bacterium]
MITNDPKILSIAFLGGIIPSLFWLYFWLKEKEGKPEPRGLLAMVFLLGMISVMLILPIQKFIQGKIDSYEWQIIFWASTEEIIKYLAALVILYKNSKLDEPLDWPIYMITVALGFAAFENTLFLIKPLSLGETTTSLLTGQLRFLGSTLLHTVSSAIIGISLGLSFYMKKYKKKIYLLGGILFAITLHSVFNFFIMKDSGNNFLRVFALLWVMTVVVMLLFEKLKRMSGKIS